MPLVDLKNLMNANAQNLSQVKGLSAAYGILLGGTPSIDGYTFLINANNTSNFGAGATGPRFNDENIYINTISMLFIRATRLPRRLSMRSLLVPRRSRTP